MTIRKHAQISAEDCNGLGNVPFTADREYTLVGTPNEEMSQSLFGDDTILRDSDAEAAIDPLSDLPLFHYISIKKQADQLLEEASFVADEITAQTENPDGGITLIKQKRLPGESTREFTQVEIDGEDYPLHQLLHG